MVCAGLTGFMLVVTGVDRPDLARCFAERAQCELAAEQANALDNHR
jgi:hypothetical protein